MTLELIRNQIWQHIGEPPDLDPSTDTQYNSGPLLTWVANRGQHQVAMWKDPNNNSMLRIRELVADMHWQAQMVDSTLDTAGTTTTVVFPSGDVGEQDDRYNGWIVEVDGVQRMIVDYTGSSRTATVHKAFSSAPAGTEDYKLYKNFMQLTVSGDPWSTDHIVVPAASTRYRTEGNLLEPLRIRKIETQHRLRKVGMKSDYTQDIWTKGDPASWQVLGNKIYFDRQLDEEDWYQMWYYRTPTDMSADADEPEIPEVFHWAICLWGIWWGFSRDGESAQAYSKKQDFEREMRRLKNQWDTSNELEYDWGTLQLE